MRPIDIIISTKGRRDKQDHYLYAGNYNYRITDYLNGNFIGNIVNGEKLIFSPISLVTMMSSAQNRLIRRQENLLNEERILPRGPPSFIQEERSIISNGGSLFRSSGNLIIRPPSSENPIVRRYIPGSGRNRVVPSPISTFDAQPDECTICLQKFSQFGNKFLRCGHKYHNLCIEEWFENDETNRCPLCRAVSVDTPRPDPFLSAITELRRDISNNMTSIMSRSRHK